MKEKIRRKLIGLLKGPEPVPAKPTAPKRPGLRTSLQEVMEHVKGNNFVPRTVIDIGFNTGTPGLYGHFPQASHLIVDPLQENEIFMQHQVAHVNDAHYVVAAAGAAEGELEITVTPDFGGSSTYLKGSESERRKVPVKTLDSLVERFGLKGPYLLKIDVQGAELDVLKGAVETLRQTEVVIAEARFFPFAGSPEIFEVLKFLDDQGFALYDLFNVTRRPSDGALGQIDLVAVRKEGAFRTPTAYKSSATYRTPEQRKRNVEGKLKKREEALRRIQKEAPACQPQ